MKLLLIRHGDPDYTVDGLTPTGKAEAELLSDMLSKTRIDACYVSTHGRAMDTAKPTLEKLGMEGIYCDWLREFSIPVDRPDCEGDSRVPWDWLPADWLQEPRFLHLEQWATPDVFASRGLGQAYDAVTAHFDEVLASYGYVREGRLYRVERPGEQTVAFFCHLGLACVLLSHLIHVSPMVLWQGTAMAPSSVTTVVSEERRQGIASFRATAIGDISHLYCQGRSPSFAGRFCEVWGNGDRED